MSYKNPKVNKSFDSYDNGERSHMVSGDALGAIGDSHNKFDAAMEAGKQIGAGIVNGVKKYQAEKQADKEYSDKKALEKKTLDAGGSIKSGGKEYTKATPEKKKDE